MVVSDCLLTLHGTQSPSLRNLTEAFIPRQHNPVDLKIGEGSILWMTYLMLLAINFTVSSGKIVSIMFSPLQVY